MNEQEAVDRRLQELSQTRFSDPADGLAALLEAAGAVNEALAAESDETTLRGVEARGETLSLYHIQPSFLRSSDVRERLRRWIEKLRQIAKSIAEQFQALSYSVSVSIPGGVSVGVSWST